MDYGVGSFAMGGGGGGGGYTGHEFGSLVKFE